MPHKLPACKNEFYVYIMASLTGTLYTGSTSNIISRVYEHKSELIDGFTKKYHCNRLVYYEELPTKEKMLVRELQIKKYNRNKKEQLIKTLNPEWKDLSRGWYDDLVVIQPLIHRKGIPRRSSSGL